MNAKLTLKLDQQVIESTKHYARRHGTSLSRLVEDYFSVLVRDSRKDLELTGIVAELAGIAKGADAEDPNEGYAVYLTEKYS